MADNAAFQVPVRGRRVTDYAAEHDATCWLWWTLTAAQSSDAVDDTRVRPLRILAPVHPPKRELTEGWRERQKSNAHATHL